MENFVTVTFKCRQGGQEHKQSFATMDEARQHAGTTYEIVDYKFHGDNW